MEGQATFGFVSRYKKGATIPTGNTAFGFAAGNLYFQSASYEWLVVTGSDHARFKGSGTINGGGDYKFMPSKNRNFNEGGPKMKANQKFIIVFTAVLAIALISPGAWAKKEKPPVPPPCGLTGTWTGDAEGSLAGLAIHTSTDGIKGEMLMNWVYNNLFKDGPYEMAPGHGVWELIDTGTYRYTWHSQVKLIDSDPAQPIVLPIRVYGTAQMQDCDNVIIYYDFEIQSDQNGVPTRQPGNKSWKDNR